MLPRPPSSDVEAFRAVLRASKNIVAIAGAGLSAASGIPTFRDAGGLWRSYDPMKLATPEAFARDPSKVWQFYHYRREVVLNAQPNAGHFALAKLCDPTTLHTIAPNATFTLVTQNVDGLSVRALQQTITGAPSRSSDQGPDKAEGSVERATDHERLEKAEARVIEMHGRLLDTLCTSCGRREANTASPICAALAGTEALDDFVDIPVERLPRCARCGGLTRPGVVWFGEVPRKLRRINEVVQAADLALIVGTSSTVFPAAGFAYEVAEHGGDVAVFNIQRSEGDRDADFLFLGPCEETLPSILFGGEADTV